MITRIMALVALFLVSCLCTLGEFLSIRLDLPVLAGFYAVTIGIYYYLTMISVFGYWED